MIDLNTLNHKEHNAFVHRTITAIFKKVNVPGTNFTPNDIELLVAEELKDSPLANSVGPVVSRLLHAQMYSVMVLGASIEPTLSSNYLDRDEFIFALSYLAAAFTYVDTEKVRKGNTPVTRRDYIRLCTAAYDLMQIHGRNVERAEEQIHSKDH